MRGEKGSLGKGHEGRGCEACMFCRALGMTYIEMACSESNTLRRRKITINRYRFYRRKVTTAEKAWFLRSKGPILKFEFCLMLDGGPQVTNLTSQPFCP